MAKRKRKKQIKREENINTSSLKKKKEKAAKSKLTRIKPLKSTQQIVDIDDVTNGMVRDKDGKYSMILECIPSPFYMKKNADRNRAFKKFQDFLNISPSEIHIKSFSTSANLQRQIDDANSHIASETNVECRKMGEEYVEHLENAEMNGVTRRFFVSFPYEEVNSSSLRKRKGVSVNEIEYQMKNTRARMISALDECDVSVVKNKNNGEEYKAITSIFYDIYNRNARYSTPFEQRFVDELAKYNAYYEANGLDKNDINIPVKDLVASEKIDFSNPKYVKVSNKNQFGEWEDLYYTFLFIPGGYYPTEAYMGWMNAFVNSYNGVDVDIFFKREDAQQMRSKLKGSMTRTGIEVADNQNVASDSYANVRNAYSSIVYLKDGIDSGMQFYNVSTIITVCAGNLDLLDEMVTNLKDYAKNNYMKLCSFDYQQIDAFKAVMPFPKLNKKFFDKTKRNCLQDGAATLFPFTTFELIHDDGLYIADDLATGSPVIPDFFNKKAGYTNPHIFVCGETGAGKSVTIMLTALRARIKQMPVFIIAPEKQDEFRRLCNNIGGQFVSIGNGSPNRINIFDVFVPSQKALETRSILDSSEAIGGSLLEQKINDLMKFFKLHIGDAPDEIPLLNDAILETYNKFGMNEDNESLWVDSSHTKLKEFPTMSDLVKTLEEMEAKGISGVTRLRRLIAMLTKGTGAHFDGKTNVDVNNDFFVIGLEHNSSEFLGMSIYVAMEYMWNRVKEDRTVQKMIIMDEWWKMAYNEVAAERTMEIARLARAYGCSLIIATQQMNDVMAIEDGKFGNAVLNSCATKIVMKLQEKDVLAIKEMIDLTDDECLAIQEFNPGQALMITGNNRMRVQFTPSPTEQLLTFTDKKTLQKYSEIERNRLEEEKRKKDLERLFGATGD